MKNGWTPAPVNPNDLPWPIKAGKRVQWWVKWEAFDNWPENEFVYIGSVKDVGDYNDPRYKEKTIIADKIVEGSGIYYKEGLIIAYKDCDAGPF